MAGQRIRRTPEYRALSCRETSWDHHMFLVRGNPRRSRQNSNYCVEDEVKSLSHIFGEETQHEIAMLLQQGIFATVSSVRVRVGQMLPAVELDH